MAMRAMLPSYTDNPIPEGERHMKKHRWMLAALVMLGLAAGAQAQEKIRLGILPFSESLGAVIADKEGYFKAEGLEVEMSNVGSGDRKSTRLNSSHSQISYAVFCLKKKNNNKNV